MTEKAHSEISISDEVVDSAVGDEVILLHLGHGAYFGLDPVGTVIWEGLKAGHDRSRIRSDILAVFDVAADVVDRDIERFIEELRSHDMLAAD